MINGERVRQARELRGLRQEELAERVNITQPTISKIEAGTKQPSDEVLTAIALQTGFPPSFFRQAPPVDFPFGSLMYRERNMTPEDKKAANRYGQTLFELAERMAARMNLPPQRLRHLEEDPATAARIVRAALGLSHDAPVANLIDAVERAGVLVFMLPVALDKGDGFSEWVRSAGSDTRKPIIVLFSGSSGDRLRLTLAHELGHLVMHPRISVKQMEDEAYTFACELLVPETAMRQELIPPFGLAALAKMKVRWGISIAALIQHAKRLGIITRHQYDYLRAKMGQAGWLNQEPPNLAIPVENPRAVRKMAELMYGNPVDYQRLASDAKFLPPFARQLVEAHASREEMPRRNASETETAAGREAPLDNISDFSRRHANSGRAKQRL